MITSGTYSAPERTIIHRSNRTNTSRLFEENIFMHDIRFAREENLINNLLEVFLFVVVMRCLINTSKLILSIANSFVMIFIFLTSIQCHKSLSVLPDVHRTNVNNNEPLILQCDDLSEY